MRSRGSVVATGVVVPILICTAQVLYAADPKAILEAARAKSGAYAELVAALTGPDPSIRATVFDEMVKSGDGTLRTLAIETGFSSDDSVLQALALKYSIISAGTLNVRMLPDKSTSERTKKMIAINGAIIPVVIEQADSSTGSFTGTFCRSNMGNHPDCKASGQVQGLSVSVASGSCKFSGKLTDKQEVIGFAECTATEMVPSQVLFR